jgi:ketosteroid isomerase-like protein
MTTPAAKQSQDPELDVREANRRFYQAFAALDVEQMDAVWLHEDWVECVHPGWDLLLGWEEVRESWTRIFSSTQRVQVEISSVWVRVEGDVAWVACTEHLTSTFERGFDQVRVQATNLFVLREVPGATGEPAGPRWYLVAHHGSPLTSGPPAPLQ